MWPRFSRTRSKAPQISSPDSEPEIPDTARVDDKDIDEDIVKNITCHLAVCRDAILSQENRHKEFVQRALGIITFSVALFGFGVRWTPSAPAALIQILVGLLGILAATIAVIGLAYVIKPGTWKESRRLDSFQKIAFRAKHSTYLSTLVDAHRKAAETNATTLESRGAKLKIILWMAVGQLGIFALLALVIAFCT